ncbi:uncharacterized protein METZ01_LOCUS345061, partial [marine metagenome]
MKKILIFIAALAMLTSGNVFADQTGDCTAGTEFC